MEEVYTDIYTIATKNGRFFNCGWIRSYAPLARIGAKGLDTAPEGNTKIEVGKVEALTAGAQPNDNDPVLDRADIKGRGVEAGHGGEVALGAQVMGGVEGGAVVGPAGDDPVEAGLDVEVGLGWAKNRSQATGGQGEAGEELHLGFMIYDFRFDEANHEIHQTHERALPGESRARFI